MLRTTAYVVRQLQQEILIHVKLKLGAPAWFASRNGERRRLGSCRSVGRFGPPLNQRHSLYPTSHPSRARCCISSLHVTFLHCKGTRIFGTPAQLLRTQLVLSVCTPCTNGVSNVSKEHIASMFRVMTVLQVVFDVIANKPATKHNCGSTNSSVCLTSSAAFSASWCGLIMLQ